MSEINTYYLAKRLLPHYADTTEPNLYPDGFEALVLKTEYLKLQQETKSLRDALILVKQRLLELGYQGKLDIPQIVEKALAIKED